MLNGVMYVIFFSIGLFIGLKLEYKKKKTEKTFDEEFYNDYKNTDEKHSNTNEEKPIELTPEIIDEWMNGSEIE